MSDMIVVRRLGNLGSAWLLISTSYWYCLEAYLADIGHEVQRTDIPLY